MFKRIYFFLLGIVSFMIFNQTSFAQSGITVTLKDKSFKGKTIKAIDINTLSDGQYSIKLTDNEQIQFNVLNKKVIKSQAKMISTGQQLGYSCSGILCTCNPDTDPADCDRMIDEQGCEVVIDIDNVAYCIKKTWFVSESIKNNKVVLQQTVVSSTDNRVECEAIKAQINAKSAELNKREKEILAERKRKHLPIDVEILPVDRSKGILKPIRLESVPQSALDADGIYRSILSARTALSQRKKAIGCQ
jgi:hypothetical protein